MKQWMKRTSATVLAGLALTSSALASGTAVTLQENAVPATQITASAQQDWRLLLVNAWNLLPESYTVELVRLKNGLQVDKRIYDDLNAMLTDCRAAGLQPIVCSAYRTQATQTRLYNNKVSRLRAVGYSAEEARVEAARWVAPPGTSEHQTGLALDLVSLDYQLLDEKQEQTPEQQWLMAHSWEYGFVLRYPSDKSAITGIGYEPWHYRYVGKEAAKAMHESGPVPGGVCRRGGGDGTRGRGGPASDIAHRYRRPVTHWNRDGKRHARIGRVFFSARRVFRRSVRQLAESGRRITWPR